MVYDSSICSSEYIIHTLPLMFSDELYVALYFDHGVKNVNSVHAFLICSKGVKDLLY